MKSVTYRPTLSKFRGGPVKKITLYLSIVLNCQTTAKKSKLLARAAIVHALLEFLNLKINVEDDWIENLGNVEGCKIKFF